MSPGAPTVWMLSLINSCKVTFKYTVEQAATHTPCSVLELAKPLKLGYSPHHHRETYGVSLQQFDISLEEAGYVDGNNNKSWFFKNKYTPGTRTQS